MTEEEKWPLEGKNLTLNPMAPIVDDAWETDHDFEESTKEDTCSQCGKPKGWHVKV